MGLVLLPAVITELTAQDVEFDGDETQLQGRIDAATPVIEDMCGPVVSATVTKTFDGGRTAIVLPSAVATVVSVTENGSPMSDYVIDGTAGVLYAGLSLAPRSFFPGRQNIVVQYTVGSASVPANIKAAALELITHWWRNGQQGARPAWDELADDEVYTPSGFPVPRRVSELCGPNPAMPGFA
jgi:hypothetical protein